MSSVIESRKPNPETASWYQSTADHRRQNLFAPGIIPLFAASLLIILWMALPSKELAERLAHVQRSDLLTIAYLKAWLAAKGPAQPDFVRHPGSHPDGFHHHWLGVWQSAR